MGGLSCELLLSCGWWLGLLSCELLLSCGFFVGALGVFSVSFPQEFSRKDLKL